MNRLMTWRNGAKKAFMGGGEKRAAAHRNKENYRCVSGCMNFLTEAVSWKFKHFATGRMSEHVGDGVVTGTGHIHGRPVCVYAQDATVHGGGL
ncbi:carboxyl transferase domain-containing protein [Bacillus sp. SL00103]